MTANVTQGLEQLQAQVQHLQDQVQGLQAQVPQAEELLLMRLYNSPLELHSDLMYPPGIDREYPMPLQKADLRDLTIGECIFTAARLRLPPPLITQTRPVAGGKFQTTLAVP